MHNTVQTHNTVQMHNTVQTYVQHSTDTKLITTYNHWIFGYFRSHFCSCDKISKNNNNNCEHPICEYMLVLCWCILPINLVQIRNNITFTFDNLTKYLLLQGYSLAHQHTQHTHTNVHTCTDTPKLLPSSTLGILKVTHTLIYSEDKTDEVWMVNTHSCIIPHIMLHSDHIQDPNPEWRPQPEPVLTTFSFSWAVTSSGFNLLAIDSSFCGVWNTTK